MTLDRAHLDPARSTRAPLIILVVALAMVTGACGGDVLTTVTAEGAASSSTTSATSTTGPAASTVPIPVVNGPALVAEGDVGETARAFQWLLDCNGYGPLAIDGAYGAASVAAMQAAQADLNREATGEPDEETLGLLSRSCSEVRPIEIADHDFGVLAVIGNAAPGDTETMTITIAEGDQLTIDVISGNGVSLGVFDAAGDPVGHHTGTGWETIFTASGDYVVQVSAVIPATFEIELRFFKSDASIDTVALAHRGLIVQGEQYYLGPYGADPEALLAAITSVLGDPALDSGWGPHPIFDGREYRSVLYGDGFWLSLTDTPESAGARHLTGYSYTGSPDGIETVMAGITVGSTVGEVVAAVSGYRPEAGLDLHAWVQTNIAQAWVLEVGNPEFGYLCFETGLFEQPADDAAVTRISASEEACIYDGE